MNSHASTQQVAPVLSVQGLACLRDEKLLFKNIAFELAAGQALHIIGSNGAGKTSLLYQLAGILDRPYGEIDYAGAKLNANDLDFQNALCFIAHQAGVNPHLTPRENLHYSVHTNQSRESTAIIAALTAVGLADVADSVSCHLSAGQQRRLALARLFLSESTLWLLDEPFTALDETSRKIIAERMLEHLKYGGVLVFTSHQAVDFLAFETQQLELVA